VLLAAIPLIARVGGMRIKPNSYSYSEPIVIKEWSGGRVTVAVGYVTSTVEERYLSLEDLEGTRR